MISLWRRLTAAAVLATAIGTGPGPATPAGAATPADRCYTAALHEVFLDRPASAYDLEAWADRYEPAPVRPALPRALAASDQWLEAVVDGIYLTALEREPDPSGLAFWIGRLRAGTRVTTLTAQVYGSDEVWARGGSTREGFVEDVFPRIMGRQPTTADVAYWAGELGHQGPGDVAKRLLGTIENRRARVTALYLEVLGRAPDAAGRDYWAGRLVTLDDVVLAVQLASSSEAYQRAQVDCGVPPPPTTTAITDGDAKSRAPKISDDGRWIAFTSGARDLVPGDDQDEVVDLFLHDRTTGTTTKVTDAGFRVHFVALSADGRHVAFAARGVEPGVEDAGLDVFSWERETGTFTRITDGAAHSSSPSISADGGRIAFKSDEPLTEDDDDDDEDVFLWDRAAGTTELVSGAVAADGEAVGARITAGGDRIAYQTLEGDTIRLVTQDLAGGTTTPVDEGFVLPLDIGGDGDILYSRHHLGGETSDLLLWDAGTGTVTTVLSGDNASNGADLATDGATVVFGSFANGLYPGDTHDSPDVFVWERATGTIAHIGRPGADGSVPTTSADGRFVAYHATTRRYWPPPAQIEVWDRGS